MINWEPLTSERHVGELVDKSHESPVMIFKHSTRCGVSFSALDTLIKDWNPEKVGQMATYMLDVIMHRDYAREIGQHFGIPHQSPQVLIIDRGNVVYEQSHFGINFGEVEEVMHKLNG